MNTGTQGPAWLGRSLVVLALVAMVVSAIPPTASAGPVDDFVTNLYQQVLRRTPSPDEVAAWANYLRQNPGSAAVSTVVRAFFDSPEFVSMPQTPTTYAGTLYKAILGRDPDPVGQDGIAGVVQNDLTSLVGSFVDSPEFHALLAVSTPSAIVTRLYREVLGRTPGSGESAAWVAMVAAGDGLDVARGIFGSPEYASTLRTLAQHITMLYRALLGRDPAPREVDAWLQVLLDRLAKTRELFVGSVEFGSTVAALASDSLAAQGSDSAPGSRSLSAADVMAIVRAAAESVDDTTMVIVVVDRMGNPLAVFRKPDAPATTTVGVNFRDVNAAGVDPNELALSVARTAAFFSHNEAPLSSRTVRFITQIHFPPGVRDKPNGDQYGIENTNRGCSSLSAGVRHAWNTTFNPGKTINPPIGLRGLLLGLPCDAFDPSGCSLGLTTGKADIFDSDPNSFNGGGVPIYKNGVMVGGIGVAASSTGINEFAALTGSIPGPGFGPRVLSPGVIFLGSIQLPFVNQTTRPAGHGPGTFTGSFVVNPIASALGDAGVPDGYLVGPRAGSQLTADEVAQIVAQSNNQAAQTRAAIRLPPGQPAKFMISVADLDGSLLAVFRETDATVFSIDVSITKARNVVYYSSPTHNQAELPGVPPGIAVNARVINFGSQPIYPPGIDRGPRGPFFQSLFVPDVQKPCTQGLQPPNANQSGTLFFPGSTPLYRNGQLVGGLGVSGDGVDQDDLVSAAGATGFEAPESIRADQIILGGTRLPFFKFPRNPEPPVNTVR